MWRFDNAGGGYYRCYIILNCTLELFHNKKMNLKKNVSPQKAHMNTHKKPSLNPSTRKCITDLKQSFSNKFLDISLAVCRKDHYSFQ